MYLIDNKHSPKRFSPKTYHYLVILFAFNEKYLKK